MQSRVSDVTLAPEVSAILAALDDPLRDPAHAVSMPLACYTSEAWFEFERRAIWDREWVCLGHVATVPQPGDYFRVTINDDPFLVVRGLDGEVRALSAVCQHRGHILGDAHGHARRFICPYHGWTYEIDGTLAAAPSMAPYATLAELQPGHCLPRLRTEIWNGFVFINLDGHAAPLAPRLRGISRLVRNHRLGELSALPPADFPDNPWNWKWMQENGLEPYHTPVCHQGTHDVAPARQSVFPPWDDADDGAIYYTTRFIHIDGQFSASQKCVFPIIPGLTEEDRWRVMFGVVPPNLLIATVPDCAFYFVTIPHGANAITLRVGYLFPAATIALADFNERFERLNSDINAINLQDITANVSVQLGRRSRFANRGRIAPLELPVVQFNHWLVTRYRRYLADHGGVATSAR